MTFHPTRLHLSEKQIHALHRGETIRMKHEHLLGEDGDEIHLDKRQMHKLEAVRKSGKGSTLCFSPDQVQYHKMRGAGRISDLLRNGLSFVKDKALDGVSALGSYGIGKVIDAVAKPLVNLAPGFASPYVQMGADIGKKYSQDKCKELIDGLRTVHGEGLFDIHNDHRSMSDTHNNMIAMHPAVGSMDGSGMSCGSKMRKAKKMAGSGLLPPGY